MREALELSLNMPAVAMLDAVGPARLMARLRAAGVVPVLPEGEAPGLAGGLGGMGVTLNDLAGLYCDCAIARGGLSVALREMRDESKGPAASGTSNGAGRHVLSSLAAWYVSDILSGTPAPVAAVGGRIAFKTGTSYGYRDAWVVGFDGDVVIAVWTGRGRHSRCNGLSRRRADSLRCLRTPRAPALRLAVTTAGGSGGSRR
ncbi:hypothetical protein [Breoghania sp.]|uniref:hypothetical protein n=1 Tax=Breoghania sp. TaxID=2065378 RepID=UPI002619BBB8|nr:hypothetical protein [Breoghania sp.]MDJ0932250.1 hypothetical protein [Breoghania sp.]